MHATSCSGRLPSGLASRQTYQSRFGLSRELREFDEPGMLIRGVVRHEIDDDVDVAPVRLGQPAGRKSASVPNIGSTSHVVGHVVAEIGHRRWVKRRQPDRIDTHRIAQIRQFIDDAREVANAVAVTVLKTARIDLVDNAALPP